MVEEVPVLYLERLFEFGGRTETHLRFHDTKFRPAEGESNLLRQWSNGFFVYHTTHYCSEADLAARAAKREKIRSMPRVLNKCARGAVPKAQCQRRSARGDCKTRNVYTPASQKHHTMNLAMTGLT